VGRLLLLRSTAKKDLVSAMAWLTVPALVGPMMGPPLGGFITTYFTWHWIFIINIPIGIAGIILATKYLPKSGIRVKSKLDIVGFLLAGTAFSGMVFGLSVISLPALPPIFGAMILFLGCVSGIAYWRHAFRIDAPILNPRIFSDSAFAIANLWGALFRLSIGAFPFLVPLMLQIGYGLNPLESGLITFAGAAGALTMKFVARRTYARFGFKKVLPVAILITSGLTVSYGFINPSDYSLILIGLIFIGGLSRAMFFTGANAMMFSTLPDQDTAQGTAVSAVSAQISVAIGVAIAGSLLEISGFISGKELGLVDFQIALIVLATLSALAAIPFARMGTNVGRNVSGYRGK
jgi:MFS family permease